MNKNWTRRDFIRVGTVSAATGAAAKFTMLQPRPLWASPKPVAPSDTVRFASIGTGVRGCELLNATTHVPGIECVAVCDLYDSRHIAAQESVKQRHRKKRAASNGRLGALPRKAFQSMVRSLASGGIGYTQAPLGEFRSQ